MGSQPPLVLTSPSGPLAPASFAPGSPGSPTGAQPVSDPPGGQQPGGYPAQPQTGWFPAPAGPPTPPFALVPRGKRSTGKILVVVLVILLALCGGGAGVAYFLVKDDVKELAAATEIKLTVPDQILGRPRITQPSIQTAVDAGVASMRQAQQGVTGTVAAAYGNVAKRDVVLVVAAYKLTVNPATTLDSLVEGITASGMTNVTMADVDPGPLGGVAQCGNATASTATVPKMLMALCVWVDNGSFGSVTMYFKTGKQLAAEFVHIRSAVEHTG